jgi:hypothetical protein
LSLEEKEVSIPEFRKGIRNFLGKTYPIFDAIGDSSMDPDLQEVCNTKSPEHINIRSGFLTEPTYIRVRSYWWARKLRKRMKEP